MSVSKSKSVTVSVTVFMTRWACLRAGDASCPMQEESDDVDLSNPGPWKGRHGWGFLYGITSKCVFHVYVCICVCVCACVYVCARGRVRVLQGNFISEGMHLV